MSNGGQPAPKGTEKPSTDQEPEPGRLGVIRHVHIFAGGVTGAIVALVAMATQWPEIGPLAGTAITAIGAVAGAALGVCALALGARRP